MLGSATAAQNVAAQKPSLLVRAVNNLCLNSVPAYTAPALSPKHAFGAGEGRGRGERVRGVRFEIISLNAVSFHILNQKWVGKHH